MSRVLATVVSAAATLLFPVAAAQANHHTTHHHHAARHAAEKVHYGGKPHLGYWRRGPEIGYGFGFSSYRGDPFGSDDYYDGGLCHYLKHQDFCYPNPIFTGFRYN